MTGAGGFPPSVTKVLEHSCITSQLSSHHPHPNSDPILTAKQPEYPLAKSRQSYNVTVVVCVHVEWGIQKRLVYMYLYYIVSSLCFRLFRYNSSTRTSSAREKLFLMSQFFVLSNKYWYINFIFEEIKKLQNRARKYL